MTDNIAAISTPIGEGAISIVRVSGEQALAEVDSIFRAKSPEVKLLTRPSHTLTLGWIMDRRRIIIDEVLVGVMRGPNSYTGEDVVEINCHGGVLPAQKIMEQLLALNIRLAQPGEFTRLAFLNGRLDAVQAEAVIDIIRAKTQKAMSLAVNQLTGYNSKLILELEDILISVNAALEASMDFPDEVGDPDYIKLDEQLQVCGNNIDRLLEAGEKGRIYREGISAAIIGKPNVGKSSLLNALLRQEKAIVTAIPGTTRDVIEDFINVKGIPVRIIDMAGIRETKDPVEKIGVDKAWTILDSADIIIFVLDVAAGFTEEDHSIYQKINREKTIVLVNKDDIPDKKIESKHLAQLFADCTVIHASVKEGLGL